eukprot:COSAG04_NODE_3593_length_2684_cov_2.480077_3_plen_127_part_00
MRIHRSGIDRSSTLSGHLCRHTSAPTALKHHQNHAKNNNNDDSFRQTILLTAVMGNMFASGGDSTAPSKAHTSGLIAGQPAPPRQPAPEPEPEPEPPDPPDPGPAEGQSFRKVVRHGGKGPALGLM